MYYLKLYLATLAAFFAIDMLWLGLIARAFYRKHLGFLMRPSPNWAAAILFYLIFVAGILVFVVLPGLQASSLQKTLLLGAFYGLVTYATYDLTNLATLKDWPLGMTIVDILWGGAINSVVTYVAAVFDRWFA